MATLRPGSILDPDLECLSPEAWRTRLGQRLVATVQHAWKASPRARQTLEQSGLSPTDIRGLDDLARIPITRKDSLPGLQDSEPPFGGLTGVALDGLARLFMSPGPIYDPQGHDGDFWRFRHGMAAAGFRRGDVVLNSGSYHLTPLGFMLDGAARALGCPVIPGGVGQTELQLKAASHLRATAYTGTPSFLFQLLSRARETGTPLFLEAAFVSAEMLPESLRADIEAFGVRCRQGYGTADLGCLSYECSELGGWHLHPDVLIEVLDLETGRPAAPGQPGEIVGTLFEEAYPLLRFATGDIGALAPPARCACGRVAPKLAGLMGRVGDAVKVKGMFVRGAQMEAVLKGFPEAGRFRAVVTRDQHLDLLVYEVESDRPGDTALAITIAEALREVLKVRGEVTLLARGAIPEGSKKIEDRRVWK
jgi:phenylacetate-CoA ligase